MDCLGIKSVAAPYFCRCHGNQGQDGPLCRSSYALTALATLAQSRKLGLWSGLWSTRQPDCYATRAQV